MIFDEKSAVRARQIEYARSWGEVHIVVFKEKSGIQDLKLKIAQNCFIYSTESFSKFLYPWDAIRIGRSVIKESRVTDITCQDPSLTAKAGVALKEEFGIPLEIQIHTDIGSPYFTKISKGYFKQAIGNKIRLAMAKRYLLKADKIRVVSDRIRDYVDELVAKRATDISKRPLIEVRPIAIDAEAIKSLSIIAGSDLRKKYPQFDKIALVASRFEAEKNIGLAIKAWKEVIKPFPNAGLVIVGRGSEKVSLRRLVEMNGLGKAVAFEDWASPEAIGSYFKTVDLFLNTSLFEGYGLSIVQALVSGVPVVSTDVGIAKEKGAVIAGFEAADFAQKTISVMKSLNK